MITELYVPRDRLADFMAAVGDDFRAHGVDVIYGTIRLIERDDESVPGVGARPYACVIFNRHTDHAERASTRAGRRLPATDRPRASTRAAGTT